MAVGPGEISALVTSFKVVLDLARGTKAAIDALDDAEVKFKMAELYSALADAKIAVADAQESMTAKEGEIERLKATFQRVSDDTVAAQDLRFRKGSKGQPVGKPFCPRCLEVDGRLILVQTGFGLAKTSGPNRPTRCPQCKTDYNILLEFLEEPLPPRTAP